MKPFRKDFFLKVYIFFEDTCSSSKCHNKFITFWLKFVGHTGCESLTSLLGNLNNSASRITSAYISVPLLSFYDYYVTKLKTTLIM